jgi:hypothetical protein
MKLIAKAIISVMKDVKGMEKNSNVGSGKNSYSGTKDQDVKEVFNESMAKNGLCILPIGIDENTTIDRWEGVDPWSKSSPKDKKMFQSVFTKVVTKYLLLHESGESIELAGYGHGIDPQDKGAGKATTYALKNCLLYAFLTPVGKIDDSEETHSSDIAIPVSKEPNMELSPSQLLNNCKTLAELQAAYTKLSASDKTLVEKLKDELKTKLK